METNEQAIALMTPISLYFVIISIIAKDWTGFFPLLCLILGIISIIKWIKQKRKQNEIQ